MQYVFLAVGLIVTIALSLLLWVRLRQSRRLSLFPMYPDKWVARVRRARSNRIVEPVVSVLREIVATHGKKAIALEEIRLMAGWLCGYEENPLVPYERIFQSLLDASGGEAWPLSYPISERGGPDGISSKDLVNIALDLESIRTEYLCLHHATLCGCKPIAHRARSLRREDWQVESRSESLFIEAKNKSGREWPRVVVENMLQGLIVTREWQFLRLFDWKVGVDEVVRATHIAKFFRDFCDSQSALRTSLSQGNSCGLAGDLGLIFVEDGKVHVHNQQTIYIDGFPSEAREGRVLLGEAYFGAPKLGDAEAEVLMGLVEKAGILRQAKQRPDPTLFVLRWRVPFEWEDGLSRDWVVQTWSDISDRLSLPPTALWPICVFGAGKQNWIPNTRAREELSDEWTRLWRA